MRADDDIRAILDQERDPADRAALLATAERLEHERPVPSAGFRAMLRRRLLDASGAGHARPGRLRTLVAVYAGSGSSLLAIAAIGLAGVGPLAP
jgi:hypothetical protein